MFYYTQCDDDRAGLNFIAYLLFIKNNKTSSSKCKYRDMSTTEISLVW